MHLHYEKIGITENGDLLIKFKNGDHTLLFKEDLELILENLLILYKDNKIIN